MMEDFWQHHSRRVFELQSLKGPDGLVTTWKQAFISWWKALRDMSAMNAGKALRATDGLPTARWIAVWRRNDME